MNSIQIILNRVIEKTLFVSSGTSSNFSWGILGHSVIVAQIIPEGVALSLGLLSVECEQKNRIIAPLILLILKRPVKWFELRVALSRLEKPCVIFSAG